MAAASYSSMGEELVSRFYSIRARQIERLELPLHDVENFFGAQADRLVYASMVAPQRYVRGFALGILGEFLSCLEGIEAGDRIITIATTNDVGAIEPALRDRPNRFEIVLEIPPMAEPERREFLLRWQAHHPTFRIDVEAAIPPTDGFTGAQMQEIVSLTVLTAIEQQLRAGQSGQQPTPIEPIHFTAPLKRCNGKPKKNIGFAPGE